MSSDRPSGKKKPVIPGWSNDDGDPPPERPRGKKARKRKRPATGEDAGESRDPSSPEPVPSPTTEDSVSVAEVAGSVDLSSALGSNEASSDAAEPSAAAESPSFTERMKQWKTAALRRPGLVAGVVVGLLLLVVLGDYLFRRPSGGTGPAEEEEIVRPNPADVPLPDDVAGRVQVYTKGDTGFVVLVDGEPVRTEDGEFLATPCEIVLDARRAHRVTVAKEGFVDATKRVQPSTGEATELIYEPASDPDGTTQSLLDAKWFDLKAGEKVRLATLNDGDVQTDPFVTADGLSLYYVSKGIGGAAVHHATRSSPFEPFANPTDIRTTSSFGMPRSPGVISVQASESAEPVTYLVYTTKSQVESVVRRRVLSDFGEKEAFLHDAKRKAPWTACQMVADGHAVYWTANEKEGPVTYFSARDELDDEFRANVLKVKLAGGVPVMSADGLRQYVYDGRTLSRARREKLYEWGTKKERGREVPRLMHVPFSDLEPVAELPLEDYVPTPGYRQYFVSDDEQWMFYVDNPLEKGDLFAVRIREGRGWGYRPRGKSIPNREFEPEVIADRDPDPGDEAFVPPAPRGEDPRAQPLPYTLHWEEFRNLMAKRDYAEAAKVVRRRYGEPEFANARELLDWDLADVERVREMWRDAARGAGGLMEGDTFKNKSVTLDFVEFADGTLVGKVGDKSFTLELAGMHYTNVTQFADLVIGEDDAEAQMRVATFLYYEPDAVGRAVETRTDRAPELADEFTERVAGRMLARARMEFDRENYRPGLALLAEVREYAPESNATFDADDLEQGLYLKMSWERVGARQWEGALSGTWAAAEGRVDDSWLVSPKTYANFEMQMEYRTTAATGSGGVFFRYSAEPRRPPYGNNAAFKVQLANDRGIAPDSFSTGALFAVQAPRKNAAKRLNEWNTFRMKVDGQKVQVWINEDLVLDALANNPDIPLEGRIALDGITGGITYRRILVLDLPAG